MLKMRKENRREWDGLSQEHPNQNEIILQILLICLRKSLRYMCFPLFWHFSIHNKDWRSWFLQNSCRRILTHLQIIQSASSQSPASSQELQRESPPMPGRAFNDIFQQVKFKDCFGLWTASHFSKLLFRSKPDQACQFSWEALLPSICCASSLLCSCNDPDLSRKIDAKI